MFKRFWLPIASVLVLTACGGGGGGGSSGAGPIISQPSSPKTGHFLYVPNSGSGDISGFVINPSTGALTAAAGSPFAAGTNPSTAVVDPTAKFLYVSSVNVNGIASPQTLSGFSVNSSTGSLTVVPNSPYTYQGTTNSPTFIGVLQFDPSGSHLYWSNAVGTDTSGYSVSSTTGELTGAALQIGIPYLGFFDSSGTHYYALSSTQPANVATYSVNSTTGARTFVASQSTGQTTALTTALHPSGKFLYVASSNPRSLAAFSIGASGSLTPLTGSPFSIGGSGNTLTMTIVFSATGNFAYVLDGNVTVNGNLTFGTGAIYGFSIDPVTGIPTALPGSYATGGVYSQITRQEKYLYVTNRGATSAGVGSCAPGSQCSPSIAIFSIDANSGALAPVTGSPFSTPGTAPGSIQFDVSGKFAYLTDSGLNSVTAYSANTSTGALSVVGTYPTGSSPAASPILAGEQ